MGKKGKRVYEKDEGRIGMSPEVNAVRSWEEEKCLKAVWISLTDNDSHSCSIERLFIAMARDGECSPTPVIPREEDR